MIKGVIKLSAKSILAAICIIFTLTSCEKGSSSEAQGGDEPQKDTIVTPTEDNAKEKLILLNEGIWQSDNGQLSYIRDHQITNGWFKSVNGTKIGDTPQHIIRLTDSLLAITVNWSNIIYYIKPTGKLVAATENVANCRYLASDGNYLYVTSYSHRTALGETYEKGYVAKIDLKEFKVKSTCEVGYEPESIAFYKGKLYVSNTGGYAFSERHDYENSISVIDASTMQKITEVKLTDKNGERLANLYGTMSQSGDYLCINSSGDYNDLPASTIIFNCLDYSYRVFDFPSTYNTILKNGKFFTVGVEFTYTSQKYKYSCHTIDPASGVVYEGYMISDDIIADDVQDALYSMQNPYCVYQNPYTGHLYITDARTYASAGKIWEFDENGKKVGEPLATYINPGHIIALP